MYRIQQNINFSCFHDFLLNRECFMLNSLLAIGIHYQKELLPRKFSREHSFSILTAKVSSFNVLPYTAYCCVCSIQRFLQMFDVQKVFLQQTPGI